MPVGKTGRYEIETHVLGHCPECCPEPVDPLYAWSIYDRKHRQYLSLGIARESELDEMTKRQVAILESMCDNGMQQPTESTSPITLLMLTILRDQQNEANQAYNDEDAISDEPTTGTVCKRVPTTTAVEELDDDEDPNADTKLN
jgi:hypothetical protein